MCLDYMVHALPLPFPSQNMKKPGMQSTKVTAGMLRPSGGIKTPLSTRKGKRVAPQVTTRFRPNGLAKTGTLINIIKSCLKLSLIVSALYGSASLNRLADSIAPLLKTFLSLETALNPKAYPSSPMVLPDLDESFLMESEKVSSPKKNSKPPGSGRK